ncbi:hypothetical protein [Planomicrobium okeanokoites]|uniref:hypothetical protein n=1 Tax=Planomicrobium okeanokoites TaxID=244 RepID=UPI002491B785|nr:hypothetical protein [Planomicrobium okeanokoites]
MVVQSWSNESTLDELRIAHRKQEIVYGFIRSIKEMNLPVAQPDGSTVVREVPTLVVALPDGVTGYCPGPDFREFNIKSFHRFVGQRDAFVITKLDLEEKVAFLSGTKANEMLADQLWTELKAAEKAGTLSEKEYKATVTGINTQKGVVHARIQGQDAYMFRSEWSWNDREGIDAQVGEVISVKVTAISYETDLKMIRISRKQTLTDPMKFLEQIKKDDVIAGKVVQVSPEHGIFVEVETGVVLKGTKPRALEEPDVGDLVSCRVAKVDLDKRRGRVILLSYPQGKRKKKDLGSFLFED